MQLGMVFIFMNQTSKQSTSIVANRDGGSLWLGGNTPQFLFIFNKKILEYILSIKFGNSDL